MVRDQNASGANSSSIALLQERFKRLQRMKELRQEKELQLALSESRRRSPQIPQSNHYEVQRQTTFAPAKPQCQLSLSLTPGSQNKRAGSRGMEGPSSSSSSSSNAANLTEVTCTFPVGFENYSGGGDIDTSLRL